MAENKVSTRGYGLLERFLAKKRYMMAEKLIPEHAIHKRILDVGCGGHPLFLINSKFSQRYGLDKLITESHKRKLEAENIILDNYDVESGGSMPFDDQYFHVIILLAVFEHIEPSRLNNVISEIHRLLEPGGILILTTPAKWTGFILDAMSKLHLVSPHEIDEHKDSYSPATIKNVLNQAGFKSENIQSGYFESFMNIWVRAKK